MQTFHSSLDWKDALADMNKLGIVLMKEWLYTSSLESGCSFFLTEIFWSLFECRERQEK